MVQWHMSTGFFLYPFKMGQFKKALTGMVEKRKGKKNDSKLFLYEFDVYTFLYIFSIGR